MLTLHVNGLVLSVNDESSYAVITYRHGNGYCYECRVSNHDPIHLKLRKVLGFGYTDEIVKVSDNLNDYIGFPIESVVFRSSDGVPRFTYHA